MRYRLAFLLLLLLQQTAFPQIPAYRHYDVNNGLPTNEVYEMKQDRQGFLWVGCDAGLVRYDGYAFKLFSNKKNRGPAISCLREDQQGRIWCTNFSGQVFFTQNDSLHLFEPWEKNYNKSFADVTIDDNNFLYITNYANSIFKYDLAGNKESVAVPGQLTKVFAFTTVDGSVLFTLLDSGSIRKITSSGVKIIPKLDEQGFPVSYKTINNFVYYNSYKRKQTLGFQRYNTINPQPVLYYYQSDALHMHPVTAQLQQLNVYPTSCFDDDEGNLFIGSANELLWFKKKEHNWILYSRLLQGNGISYITADREGNTWISTLKNGIFKIPNKQVWYLPQALFNTRSAAVNHLSTNNNNLLFAAATSGEIFGFDIYKNSSFPVRMTETRDVQALEYNSFTNELFISKTGTVTYSLTNKGFTDWTKAASNSKDFIFRNDGVFFITGSGVTALFRKANKVARERLLNEFTPVILPGAMADYGHLDRVDISGQRSKGIWLQEKENTLWVGFVDGLSYFENGQPVKLNDPVTGQPVIATGFDESAGGTLYIATVEQGIYAVSNKKIVAHYTTKDGLNAQRIKRLKLSRKYLWFISGSAVQAMDVQTKRIKTVNAADGLLSPELFDIEILHDTVYVATANGIQFFPEHIETQNNIAPVTMITGMKAGDDTLSFRDKIYLGYNTKNISIQLQGIALKSDGNFVYQYRLLPADTTWVTVFAAQNNIRFASLAPGRYTFQCRVVNEDGVVSEQTSELKFVIRKPWWQQWWFLLMAVLVIATGLYFLFKYRVKANQRRLTEQLERSKVQEELRLSQLSSLKAQMNPHFMFNALNSIQEFILLNDKRQANMYMGKFADMMRLTLDMSNKERITLEEELRSLELYLQLEALRFEEHFHYTLQSDEQIDTAHIYMPAMLIQPYVENAVKHGLLHKTGEKQLDVLFSMKNEQTLCCTVTDNGIGRKRSGEINTMRQKKYTSFASGATQKRLELLNYQKKEQFSVQYEDLADASGKAVGTRVTIYIPV